MKTSCTILKGLVGDKKICCLFASGSFEGVTLEIEERERESGKVFGLTLSNFSMNEESPVFAPANVIKQTWIYFSQSSN